jgi:adenosylcobalamin-dependent ribonucleoside-triphosphate reductase
MTGGGSGSDYSNLKLRSLPSIRGKVEPTFTAPIHVDVAEFAHHLSPPSSDGEVFKIPDSREGWVEALCVLLDLAEDGGGAIQFDVGEIRPRGSLIKGFGGTASGAAPLIEMLINVAEVLNRCVGRQPDSLEMMEIDHEIAAVVIAGGVRRSARMSLKSWRDFDALDFINCKQDPMHHWSTNISVKVDDEYFQALNDGEPHAQVVHEAVIMGMINNGEPGFWNESLAMEGEVGELCPNPCGEIGLEEFEPCCLGHVNLAAFGNDLYGAAEAVKLMTRFLVRATFADIDDPRQREVVERNRRIGVGLLGFQEWGAAHGYKYSQIHRSEILGAKLHLLKNEANIAAKSYATDLGIPVSRKTTTVAPTGSVSLMASVTAGIHPIYSKYFIRRTRYASNDPLLKEHEELGRHIENDLYSADTKVVSIPCKDPILENYDEDLIEQVDEIDLGDMLATQAFVQANWADNAVSFTVNINPGADIIYLSEAIRHFLPRLKGTTVFPDLSRPQSPYERITKEVFEMSSNAEASQAMDACSTGACPVR